jgi:hypothetical protein
MCICSTRRLRATGRISRWRWAVTNIKDILAPDEKILHKASQKRVVPGGKELAPGSIYVTDQRVVIQKNELLGLNKDFEDIYYSDIIGVELRSNIFSDELVIRSRSLIAGGKKNGR